MKLRVLAVAGALAATVVQPVPAGAGSLRAYCHANLERLPYTARIRAELGDPMPLVACCESTQNPRARNGSSRGLLQVHARAHRAWLRANGYTADDLHRVDVNIAAARHVLRVQGLRSAWAPSRSCWGR